MSIWLNCQGVWCYTGRSWANERSCFISVMSCLSWTWLYIISISSVTCSRSPVIWYRSLTDWASPLSFSQPRIYTLAVVSFEKTCEQWGKMVKYKNQVPVVCNPIRANPRFYFNLGLFLSCSKAVFWIAFSISLSSIESSKFNCTKQKRIFLTFLIHQFHTNSTLTSQTLFFFPTYGWKMDGFFTYHAHKEVFAAFLHLYIPPNIWHTHHNNHHLKQNQNKNVTG